jgi:hypothetical protein
MPYEITNSGNPNGINPPINAVLPSKKAAIVVMAFSLVRKSLKHSLIPGATTPVLLR